MSEILKSAPDAIGMANPEGAKPAVEVPSTGFYKAPVFDYEQFSTYQPVKISGGTEYYQPTEAGGEVLMLRVPEVSGGRGPIAEIYPLDNLLWPFESRGFNAIEDIAGIVREARNLVAGGTELEKRRVVAELDARIRAHNGLVAWNLEKSAADTKDEKKRKEQALVWQRSVDVYNEDIILQVPGMQRVVDLITNPASPYIDYWKVAEKDRYKDPTSAARAQAIQAAIKTEIVRELAVATGLNQAIPDEMEVLGEAFRVAWDLARKHCILKKVDVRKQAKDTITLAEARGLRRVKRTLMPPEEAKRESLKGLLSDLLGLGADFTKNV